MIIVNRNSTTVNNLENTNNLTGGYYNNQNITKFVYNLVKSRNPNMTYAIWQRYKSMNSTI